MANVPFVWPAFFYEFRNLVQACVKSFLEEGRYVAQVASHRLEIALAMYVSALEGRSVIPA